MTCPTLWVKYSIRVVAGSLFIVVVDSINAMKFSLRIMTTAVAIFVGLFGTINFVVSSASAAPNPLQSSLHVTIQNTTISSQDPLPGQQGHQLAMVLPPRSDGKLWVGTITWTSSKPVELVVLHGYKYVTADAAHGVPFFAKPVGWGLGLSTVAITIIAAPSNPIPSGTAPFVGSAVAFYTLNGAKFTVTYSVDAAANSPT
jgi:hypothetical protein